MARIYTLRRPTELKIDLSDDVRRVRAPQGLEAYFEVRHDEKKPFEVKAGDVVVRDVGTQFSVRTFDDGRLEVIVSEGAVEMSFRPERSQSSRDLVGRRSLERATPLC